MNVQLKTEINHSYELIETANHIKLNTWIEHILFTPHWWGSVALSVVPWVMWFVVHSRERRYRLLFVGFIATIIASFLDFLGVQFGLWMYYYEVFPWIPAYLPWDWTLIPVIIMLLLEWKPKLSPYIKAFLFAFLTAFVGEPLFVYFQYYEPINWYNTYSFIIYFILYLICHKSSRLQGFQHIEK
ncbi:CBO0543 family protein [Salirhabdus salicampi]|uniref:CBO0543 family protein n=1 Tax=Salirhabdus salicampi TaxID=476102 RepID=UPI0020C1F231|nr:CBO0543 family protein [Salirhabdus salicampi]MCP8615420.1 hypothetical protein [Salirhabdus salicampi]